VLKDKIAHRLIRPAGRHSLTKVKRFYEDFEYPAASWNKPRRVIAKIEWHPSEWFPRVGVIVINMPMEPHWVVWFYNQCGTAEQHIKEGNCAFRWTRRHAGSSTTTRCGCNCTRWPINWLPSCAASNCQRRWPTGR
jgi:hypothetical protein